MFLVNRSSQLRWVRGKSFVRLKDAKTLVVMCAIDEKEILLEVDSKIYFETDHYKGWPAVLVRLDKISAAKLRHRLEQAWRLKAPKRLLAAFSPVGWVSAATIADMWSQR